MDKATFIKIAKKHGIKLAEAANLEAVIYDEKVLLTSDCSLVGFAAAADALKLDETHRCSGYVWFQSRSSTLHFAHMLAKLSAAGYFIDLMETPNRHKDDWFACKFISKHFEEPDLVYTVHHNQADEYFMLSCNKKYEA